MQIDYEQKEEQERHAVGEVAVTILGYLSILLGLGALCHKIMQALQ